MGAFVRCFDSSKTSLGPIPAWPQSLKTTVDMLLLSPVPIVLLWGPDGVMIYNDAYSVFAGGRHPSLLGSKVREGWPEVADFNDNVMKVGLGGGTLSYRDQELTLHRKGPPEQVWMNLDYSPVLDESGAPAGVLAIVVETSERVCAERALAKAEERLSHALNASGMVGIFDWHIASDVFYSDARFAAMFSVDPEKGSTGAPLSDYLSGIHPDDRDRITTAIEHAIKSKEKYVQEYRLLQKDGTVRWIEARGECLYDEHGQPSRFPGVAVDITARKKAEDAQKRSADIIESSDDAIIGMDLDAIITTWNSGAERLYGFTAKEAIGQPVAILLPRGRLAEEPEILHQISQGKHVDHYETVRQRKDGTLLDISLTVSPVRDASGRIVGASKIARDITARKRAEEALRESEERRRMASEAAQIGVWDYELTTDTLRWDERTKALFGLSADAAVSYELFLAGLHPEDREATHAAVQHSIDPNGEGEYDIEYRTVGIDDGVTRWIAARGKCYFENGRAVRFIGTVLDIGPAKEAQERQRLLLREMNHRVKNLFAIVSGMIGLSARTARTPQEMAQSLHGRLNALIRANDLVRPGIMGGEPVDGEQTTMEALVKTVLLPYSEEKDGADRIVVIGPEVTVGANAVTSLALVLHESATNAAKYGALSEPGGSLRINWNTQGNDFRFKWEEIGGPAIAGPPQARGFGSILAERSVAGQLGGTITYDWRPAGLRLNVAIPMGRLAS